MRKGFAEELCRNMNEVCAEFRADAGITTLSPELEQLLALVTRNTPDDLGETDKLELICEAEAKVP